MPHTYLLLLRFTVLNIAAFAILAYLWLEGWIVKMIEQDVTRITLIIIGVFIIGWIICCFKAIRCSRELNAVVNPAEHGPSRAQWYVDLAAQIAGDSRATIAECLRSRLYARIRRGASHRQQPDYTRG